MDVGRVASLYIHGLESFLPGNDIAFTLTFQQPFDAPRLLNGFESLIRKHLGLRVRLEASGDRFTWAPLTDSAAETGLAQQREWFERTFTAEEILSRPLPVELVLPARITRIDSQRLIFQTRHVLANGITTLHWIEQWLAVCDGALVEIVEAPRDCSRSAMVGMWWLLAYLAGFMLRCGWRPGRDTVDLTHGKSPVPGRSEFFVKTYRFTIEETQRVLERSRSLGLTVSQAVCAAMASALLAAQPAKSRVCISLPTDLGAFLPGFSRLTPGNYTGSLIAQVSRGAPAEPQMIRAFRWLRHGVDYWLPRTMGALARSERALSETFARTAALPIPKRGPFENLSCAVSSLGTVRLPLIQQHLKSISVSGKTQTIQVAVVSLNGCMSVEVSAARDLFDPAEVFWVMDRAVALLSQRPDLGAH